MVTPDNVSSTPVIINEHTLVKVDGRIHDKMWMCRDCGQSRVDSLYYNEFACGTEDDDA